MSKMKTYYEMLELTSAASLDDIKRNFRREIAKYHPDKVQHLGKEFQEIAAVKTAELTQAYKTLSDETRRAEYDELLRTGGSFDVAGPGTTPPPTVGQPDVHAARPDAAWRAQEQRPEPPQSPGGTVFQQDRAGASSLIFKAAVMRFRNVLQAEFGSYEEPNVEAFQVACVPKPPFWKLKLPPRVLGRFVDQVDAASVSDSWTAASRMKKDTQRDLVVFVMGPAIAPAGELATAITEQRRKPMPAGGKLILVPVHTRNWSAHVPNDAPDVVRSLLSRLKSA
jgi:hypothetical protein